MVGSRISAGILLIGIAAASVGCGGSDDAKSGTGGQSGSGGSATGGSSSGGTSSGGTSSGGTGGGTGATGGIAEKYPGDQGIENDPDVIFADDFESYADATELWNRWDNTFQQTETRMATEPGNFYAGKQAVEFTLPATGPGAQQRSPEDPHDRARSDVPALVLEVRRQQRHRRLEPQRRRHVRALLQRLPGHAGGPGRRHEQVPHRVRALARRRSHEGPGELNIYIYHPEQRDNYGDHFFPSGLVQPNTSIPFDFGPDFVPQPDVIPDLDRWYCYEYMVKANTPGQRDGRITLWLDGKQIADFQNLRLPRHRHAEDRSLQSLAACRDNPSGETKKYYDNVVAAKSYIGPMVAP